MLYLGASLSQTPLPGIERDDPAGTSPQFLRDDSGDKVGQMPNSATFPHGVPMSLFSSLTSIFLDAFHINLPRCLVRQISPTLLHLYSPVSREKRELRGFLSLPILSAHSVPFSRNNLKGFCSPSSFAKSQFPGTVTL